LKRVGQSVADVSVDGVGEITVPVEALTVLPSLPWSYIDAQGGRLNIWRNGAMPSLLTVGAAAGAEGVTVDVPLAELLGVLQRADREAP
jgi:hypothetical protein